MASMSSRKAELTALVESLGPWDRLTLRSIIRDTPIQLATLEDLPMELICLIIPYLDLRSFYHCQRVCKVWNTLFTRTESYRSVASIFFPGWLQCLSTEGSLSSINLRQAFLRKMKLMIGPQEGRASRRVIVRLDSNWRAEPYFTPDPAAHPDGLYPALELKALEYGAPTDNREYHRFSPAKFACSGRVIWLFNNSTFAIDNLPARTRRLVCWAEGRMSGNAINLVTLTEDMVVCHIEHTLCLLVYHIEKQEFRKIHFPLRANTWAVRAQGLNLGLFTKMPIQNSDPDDGEDAVPIDSMPTVASTLTWRWDGPLKETPPVPCQDDWKKRMPKGTKEIRLQQIVFFHDWEPATFFVCEVRTFLDGWWRYECSGDFTSAHVETLVHKFVNGTYVRTFMDQYHQQGAHLGGRCVAIGQPHNDHGGIALVGHSWHRRDDTIVTTFNVWTERFSRFDYLGASLACLSLEAPDNCNRWYHPFCWNQAIYETTRPYEPYELFLDDLIYGDDRPLVQHHHSVDFETGTQNFKLVPASQDLNRFYISAKSHANFKKLWYYAAMNPGHHDSLTDGDAGMLVAARPDAYIAWLFGAKVESCQ